MATFQFMKDDAVVFSTDKDLDLKPGQHPLSSDAYSAARDAMHMFVRREKAHGDWNKVKVDGTVYSRPVERAPGHRGPSHKL